MRLAPCLTVAAALAMTSASAVWAQTVAENSHHLRAMLVPRIESGLSAQISALVIDVTVRAGDRFHRGDVLVRFDCAVQRAQLQKAQAELTVARKTLAVKRDLAQLNSAGSLEVDIADAAAAKADADVAMTSAVVSYCVIRAPFDGRVVEVKIQPYEGASTGQKLMAVIDAGELEVEVIVPSRWLEWVKPAAPFLVHIDETGKTYQAAVTKLGARVDAVSQSVKIYGKISDKARDLIAGMSGDVSFPQAPP